jgi:hypothetical protein
MIELKILPDKGFELVLEDGKIIAGRYSYWAEKRFAAKHKLSIIQLGDLFSQDNINKLTPEQVVDIALCSVEYMCRSNKEPFTYTDIDMCNWMEKMSAQDCSRLISHFVISEEVLEELKKKAEAIQTEMPEVTES